MKFLVAFVLFSGLLSCPDDPLCGLCMDGECLACYHGFAKDDGKCVASPKKLDGCLYYMSESACSVCELGWGLVRGKCSKCEDSKCATCNREPSDCSTCTHSIVAKNGTCNNDKLCPDEGCEVCKMDLQCNVCKTGYSLNQDTFRCEKSKIPNCQLLEIGNPENCSECKGGYFITSKNTCEEIKKEVHVESI